MHLVILLNDGKICCAAGSQFVADAAGTAEQVKCFYSFQFKLFCSILNRPSFAISVVGLVWGILAGGFTLLPPKYPLIIRIGPASTMVKKNGRGIPPVLEPDPQPQMSSSDTCPKYL